MPHRLGRGLGTMIAPPRRPERTLAVALIAIVAFNQPLLRLFDLGASTTIAGLPTIYVYLFAAWALVIALLAAAIELKTRVVTSNEKADLVARAVHDTDQGPAATLGRAARNLPTRGDPTER